MFAAPDLACLVSFNSFVQAGWYPYGTSGICRVQMLVCMQNTDQAVFSRQGQLAELIAGNKRFVNRSFRRQCKDLLNGLYGGDMPALILSDTGASVSELKKNPMATVSAGDGFPVTILNRNQPAFYCVPAELYEKLLDTLDDQELVKQVTERSNQPLIDIDLDSYL